MITMRSPLVRTFPTFSQLSFSRQFMLLAAVLLLTGMAVSGAWLGREIERSALQRGAALTSAYARGILEPLMLMHTGTSLDDSMSQATLDQAFRWGPLHDEVVHVKVWDRQGRIVYASDARQRGQTFELNEVLQQAFEGKIITHKVSLDEKRHSVELDLEPDLQEVYVPLLMTSEQPAVMVAELYHSTRHIQRDIEAATLRSWVMVGAVTLTIYAALYLLVQRANLTILSQRTVLTQQLDKLRRALDDNEHMRQQVAHAGVVTTTLNEQSMRRWAADLHDGPAQGMALALMQLDAPTHVEKGLGGVVIALRSALTELRQIAAGMGVPGLEQHTVGETVERAVREFQRLTGMRVQLKLDEAQVGAPLSTKLTLYRVLQSSLANARLHAPSSRIEVCVRCDDAVHMTVCDDGPGFDGERAQPNERWGLSFMQERVHLLGGRFRLRTAPGQGACVLVDLPLGENVLI
ncbi:MAG: sensor histidine kinase [Betaproteobacteria bacterium]